MIGQSTESAKTIHQWNFHGAPCQQWKITHVGNNWYTIRPQYAPNMAMDVYNNFSGNGVKVQQFTYHGRDSQQFGFYKQSNDGTYRIVTKSSLGTRNLSVQSASTANGAIIHQYGYGGANDFWWLEKADFGCAWAFKSKNNWQAGQPNCFGYALGLTYTPPLAMNQGDSVETVATRVESYVKNTLKRSIRRISGPTSQINANEYRFCMRVGNHPSYYYPRDYHFWVQTNTGAWSDKHGTTAVSSNPVFTNPSTASWDLGSYKNYYDSSTIYFAATLS